MPEAISLPVKKTPSQPYLPPNSLLPTTNPLPLPSRVACTWVPSLDLPKINDIKMPLLTGQSTCGSVPHPTPLTLPPPPPPVKHALGKPLLWFGEVSSLPRGHYMARWTSGGFDGPAHHTGSWKVTGWWLWGRPYWHTSVSGHVDIWRG